MGFAIRSRMKNRKTKKYLLNPDVQHNNCTLHGEHKEERGKNILALCYPGNRLYMERMYRKQSGYKGTWPECLCHPVEYQKKE